MNKLMLLAVALLSFATAAAQHEGHGADPPGDMTDHAGHEMHPAQDGDEESGDPHVPHSIREPQETAETPPAHAPPPAAMSGPRHAADVLFDPGRMQAARNQLRIEEGALRHRLFLADRLETAFGDGDERYAWDLQGWYGGDIHRLWLKSEGEGEPGGRVHDLEVQALYSRAVSPFFNAQFGIRYDLRPDPDRSYLVAGIQGLLPFVFEIDAALFLSNDGDLSARAEAEYDLRITQRLVLQPRLELAFAARATPELGNGSGFNSVEAGLRLRYEIRREVAPYIGLALEQKLGGTADLARAAGDDARRLQLVIGARFWF